MTRLEVPRAIGLGFNLATVPLKANLWLAGVGIQQATDIYQRFTLAGQEQADEIMLQLPAHNAAVGADALSKVSVVDRLLSAQTRNVEELEEINAEEAIVAAALKKQCRLRSDIRILKATGYGMIGNSLRQVIHNDVPAEVEASVYPFDVATAVLETAVVTNLKPRKLDDVSEMDQEIMDLRIARHRVNM